MDAQANHEERLLTVHELAKYLNLAEITVYRQTANGLIPGFRVGRSWRFKKTVIDNWINSGSGTKVLMAEPGQVMEKTKPGLIILGKYDLGEIKGELSRAELYSE